MCGIVVEFDFLVVDLCIRFIQRGLRMFLALRHLVTRLLLGLGDILRNIFWRLCLVAAGEQ
jgi:hypothetical protein